MKLKCSKQYIALAAWCCACAFTPAIQAAESNYLLGVIPYNGTLYKGRPTDYSCKSGESKDVQATVHAVVYGRETCKAKDSDQATDMYLIAYRGTAYRVAADEIKIGSRDKQAIEEIKPGEAAEKEAKAISDSIDFFDGEKALARQALQKTRPHGIAIVTSSVFDEGEYTRATGATVTFYNSSTKTIKYVTVSIFGVNAVNDIVKGASIGGPAVVIRGIGPIEPGRFATYKRNFAWHTDVVQSMRISSVKLEYMDGSSKVIKDIGAITADDAVEDFYNSMD